ncbi:MAG: hypothetical protein ABW352_17890 [Polyangiales bacterium]
MAEALCEHATEPKHKLWLRDVGHNDIFHAARGEAVGALRDFSRDLPR